MALKNKFLFTLTFIAFFSGYLKGQQFLKAHFQNCDNSPVYLAAYLGDDMDITDTLHLDSNCIYSLNISNHRAGMYQLKFNKEKSIDLIIHNETIKLSTDFNAPGQNLVFAATTENAIYQEYLANRDRVKHKMDLLEPLTTYYPRDDDFYQKIVEKYEALKDQQNQYAQSIASKYPGLLVTSIIQSDLPPSIPTEMAGDNKLEYLKENYLKNIDFTDTVLIYTNLLPRKLIDYLSLYSNRMFNKSQQVKAFENAIDQILLEASENDVMYQFVIDYLVSGFQQLGFDEVVEYIAQNNQLESTCVNDERKAELTKKLESIKKVAIGKQAPDFSIQDVYDQTIHLNSISSPYTLLIFWASWCPHCQELVPEIHRFYQEFAKKHPGELTVIAYSLDTDPSAFAEVIEKHQLSWANASDLKGWDSELVDKYGVYATPTFFLLDKDKKIVAKPMNARELEGALESK